jgi:hypothetical protein
MDASGNIDQPYIFSAIRSQSLAASSDCMSKSSLKQRGLPRRKTAVAYARNAGSDRRGFSEDGRTSIPGFDTALPPTAGSKTNSRSASSRGSTTRSESSSAAPTAAQRRVSAAQNPHLHAAIARLGLLPDYPDDRRARRSLVDQLAT